MFQAPGDSLCLRRRPVASGFAPLYHGDSRSRAVAAVLSGEVLSKGLLSVTTVLSQGKDRSSEKKGPPAAKVIFTIAEGFLLGFAVAVPPGAVTAYAVKVGIRSGFRGAWLVGLGAATVDAIYCLLALFGIASWIVEFPPARTAMLIIGGLVLTYLALVSLLEGLKKDAASRQATGESHHVPYLTGVAMTALNPLTIGFWAAVGSAVFSARTDFSPTLGALFALAVFAGSAFWFTTLASLVHAGRRFVNDVLFRLLTCAAGLILLFFGLSLFYRAAS